MAIGITFPEVLAAARTGADWAWRAVYRDLAPAVLGYLRARGAADPDNLTGEVFYQVARDAGGFDGDEHAFRSWVFVIAHHRLLDERRSASVRRKTPTDDLPEITSGDDVEDAALASIPSENVRRVLAGLTPAQRDVVLLRIVGGLSVEETAQATGRKPEAVRALQHRAITRMKRTISRDASRSGAPSR